METRPKKLIFRELKEHESLPYHLLLEADPSKERIDSYITSSQLFVVEEEEEIIGIIVIQILNSGIAEIMNVAVLPELRGAGVGSYLIENATTMAKKMNCHTIKIGTANSSVLQLSLYQKLGFKISEIKNNFFIDNYQTAIYEAGIQAKHLIMLTKEILNV